MEWSRLRSTARWTLVAAVVWALANIPAAAAALHLPFRGWGVTSDFQLVKVFGNATQYTVWPYASLAALDWSELNDWTNGLASDPWDWRYLYILTGDFQGQSHLYRFDLSTNQVVQIALFPLVSTSSQWTPLGGLGARCSSKLAKIHGGVAFYSYRMQPTGNINHVRELTSTGVEVEVGAYNSVHRFGDNTSPYLGGTHWWTTFANGFNFGPWGIDQINGPSVVVGYNVYPTGILDYGSGGYYVSTTGAKMFLVDTVVNGAVQLQYIPWGEPAFPTPPEILDLTNPAAFCKPILP